MNAILNNSKKVGKSLSNVRLPVLYESFGRKEWIKHLIKNYLIQIMAYYLIIHTSSTECEILSLF